MKKAIRLFLIAAIVGATLPAKPVMAGPGGGPTLPPAPPSGGGSSGGGIDGGGDSGGGSGGGSTVTNCGLPSFQLTQELPGLHHGMIAHGRFFFGGSEDLVMNGVDDQQVMRTYIYRGWGNGTYANPVSVGSTGGPVMTASALAVADMDNDGALDIISNGDILLLRGVGQFTTQHWGTFQDGMSLKVADINNDGHMDIVTGKAYYLWTADGTYQETPFGGCATCKGDVATIDMRNDDKQLILAAKATQPNAGELAYYLDPYTPGGTSPIHQEPKGLINGAIAVGDINKDGYFDIFYSGRNDMNGNHNGAVFINDGPGFGLTPTATSNAVYGDFGGATFVDACGEPNTDISNPGSVVVNGLGANGTNGQTDMVTMIGNSLQTSSISGANQGLVYGTNTAFFDGANRLLVAVNGTPTVSSPTGKLRVYMASNVGTDTIPPRIGTIYPNENNAADEGVVQVVVDVTDNREVGGVGLSVDGQTVGLGDGTAPYTFQWNATKGFHQLQVFASDKAGNTSSKNVTVYVRSGDQNAPQVTLASPTSGQTVFGNVKLQATATDDVGVTRVDFYLDDVMIGTDLQTPYEISYDTARTTPGQHRIKLKAYDEAGNIGTSTETTVNMLRLVEYNDGLPGARMRVSLAPGAPQPKSFGIYIHKNYRANFINYFVPDMHRLGEVALSPNEFIGQRQVYALNPAVAYPNGQYRLNVVYEYQNGEIYTSPDTIIDITGSAVTSEPARRIPTPQITLRSGTPPRYLDVMVDLRNAPETIPQMQTMEFNLWGKRSGTDVVTFVGGPLSLYRQADGTYKGTMDLSYYYPIPTGVDYGVVVSAAQYYSSFHLEDSIWVPLDSTDRQAPTVAITSPADNTTVTGTVSVTADATDNVGVTKVEFFVNGSLSSTDTTAPYAFDWDVRSLSNGTYNLTAKAYDAQGNSTTSTAIRANVNTPPLVRYISGLPGVTPVRASVSASLTNVTGLQLFISRANLEYGIRQGDRHKVQGDFVFTGTYEDLNGEQRPIWEMTPSATTDRFPSVDSANFYINYALSLGVLTGSTLRIPDINSGVTFPVNTLTVQPDRRAEIISLVPDAPLPGQQPNSVRATIKLGRTEAIVPQPVTVQVISFTHNYASDPIRQIDSVPATLQSDGTWKTGPLGARPDSGGGKVYVMAYVFNASNYIEAAMPLPVPDIDFPTVAITAPAAGATVSGTVQVAATATDNTGVSGVEFFVDGNSIGLDTTAPYTASWNTGAVANGTHVLTAKATDLSNNVGTSQPVGVNVYNIDNVPPTVSITSPIDNSDVPDGIVPVSIAASDNIGVVKTELIVDNVLIGSDLTAPYVINWDASTAAAGLHQLNAKAYDGFGNVTTSLPVIVNIQRSIAWENNGVPGVNVIDVTIAKNLQPNARAVEIYGRSLTDKFPNQRWLGQATYVDDVRGRARYRLSAEAIASSYNNYELRAVLTMTNGFIYKTDPRTVQVPNNNLQRTNRRIKIASLVQETGSFNHWYVNVNPNQPDGTAPILQLDTVRVTVFKSLNGQVSQVGNWYLATHLGNNYQTNMIDVTDARAGGATVFFVASAYSAEIGSWEDSIEYKVPDAPSVAITRPAADGWRIGGQAFTITAQATSDFPIAKIEFFIDGVLKDVDQTAPYSSSWNTTNYSDGQHTISVKLTDYNGNTATSPTRRVIINNTNALVNETLNTIGQSGLFVARLLRDDLDGNDVMFYVQKESDVQTAWRGLHKVKGRATRNGDLWTLTSDDKLLSGRYVVSTKIAYVTAPDRTVTINNSSASEDPKRRVKFSLSLVGPSLYTVNAQTGQDGAENVPLASEQPYEVGGFFGMEAVVVKRLANGTYQTFNTVPLIKSGTDWITPQPFNASAAFAGGGEPFVIVSAVMLNGADGKIRLEDSTGVSMVPTISIKAPVNGAYIRPQDSPVTTVVTGSLNPTAFMYYVDGKYAARFASTYSAKWDPYALPYYVVGNPPMPILRYRTLTVVPVYGNYAPQNVGASVTVRLSGTAVSGPQVFSTGSTELAPVVVDLASLSIPETLPADDDIAVPSWIQKGPPIADLGELAAQVVIHGDVRIKADGTIEGDQLMTQISVGDRILPSLSGREKHFYEVTNAPLILTFVDLTPAASLTLSTAGADDDAVRMYYLDGNAWKRLTVARDGTVVIPANGIYAFTTGDVETEFGFKQVYWFPNPARNGEKPVCHVETGSADEVTITVYNAAGEKVHETTLPGAGSIVMGVNAHEYPLEISGLASGVYRSVIKAKKAGYQDIFTKGKNFAIVK